MDQQNLLTLLLKLGVVTSLASILVRSGPFKRMLMREQRTLNQRLMLALSFATIFGAGVATRVITGGAYKAVDLGLEASLLAGILAGYVTGLLSGRADFAARHAERRVPDDAVVRRGRRAGRPAAGCALRIPRASGASLRCPISGFAESSSAARTNGGPPSSSSFCWRSSWLNSSGERWGFFSRGTVFFVPPPSPHPLSALLVYVTTLFAVALPLKVWNNARNETKLVEQEQLLMQARLAALSSQINPHFLFNTLNSVSSLIRTNPAQAREVVYKLSNILRRLLRKHDNFSLLRDELSFIDDYLSIEMVRFGDKLRFQKDVSPATLDLLVPSMLLQPLVENSIRHGLSGKLEGGMISIRSQADNGRIRVTVEDDGVGIPEARLATLLEQGIGVSNVNERLKVLFGDDYRMYVDSKPDAGTRIEIEFPELQASVPVAG